MADYVIRQGDCFASIAARHGVNVQALVGRGDNRRYQRDGQSPHHLRPGDVIEVPEQPPNRAAEFSSGGAKTFVVDVPLVDFALRMIDLDNHPWKDKRWTLEADHTSYEGRTDGDGWIRQQIPATARVGELCVFREDADEEPWRFPLRFGGMDPFDDEDGAIHRLQNLGHSSAHCGKQGLTHAVTSFQTAEGLPVTGELDQATHERLEARRSG